MILVLLLSCCLNAPLDVTVNSDTITAGAILPLPAADPRTAVNIGYAPNPGLARRIPRHEIVSKIQAAGFRADDLELPESILVRRHAETLNAEQVKQVVLDAFIRQFPGANIDLVSVETPAAQVGTGSVSMSASLPARFDPNLPVFVRIDVRGSGVARTVFARSVVRIEAMQPVLRTRIAANAEVRADDVEWKHSPIEGGGQVPASMDGLQGMLAKRDLDAGQVLKMDLLYMPLYVRKGESVTVKATSGGVTIAATMRAMAAGRLGDTITVQHLTGAGSTTARVIGPRTLEAIQR
jgi:flagella basal body P-ring formation protein FlgA